MRKLIFPICVVLSLSFASFTAYLSNLSFAEETTIGHQHDTVETLPEIVVTAARIEESPQDVPQNIIIIKREDIENRNVEFITDILESYTGIAVVQNGGAGKLADLFLRGGSPNQTLIMIDGVKAKSPTTGSLDISPIAVDDIERIEIVKGPQSTLYGSEAMAGVINIITKKGRGKPKVTVSAEGGSFSTYKTTASVSGSEDVWDYRVTASYFNTDGISAAKRGKEDDGYTNKSISAKIGFMPSHESGLEMNVRYFEDLSELDTYNWGVGLVDDLNYVQKGKHYLVSGKGMLSLSDNYEQILTASSTGDNSEYEGSANSSANDKLDTTMQTIDWQHNLYSGETTLTGGVEYRKESGENRDKFNKEIDNKAFYLNDKMKLLEDSFVLNVGLRYDDHKTAGSRTTHRIGALYRLKSYSMRLKGSYATGFRAPSLNELYYPFFGNVELKPEKSEGYDIGIEKDFYGERLSLDAAYFSQNYTDMIKYDPTPKNIGKAEIKGFEAGLKARPSEYIEFKASHTNMDTLDKDSNKPLTRRPGNKFVYSFEYNSGGFTALGEYIYVSERYDSAVDRNLSDYSLVNLKGQYRMNKTLSFFARIDNVFNADYEDAGGYGVPGVSAFGGIKAEF